MTTVYILHSKKLDRFYIGSTKELEVRMGFHFASTSNKFTGKADDWTLYFKMDCEDQVQALAIERHLKRMKSKVYLQNLKKYPEMSERLLKKFNSE